jgi:uncharacterized membrane protein YhhN
MPHNRAMRPANARIWISVTAVACGSLVLSQLGGFDIAAIVSKLAASSGFLLLAASSGAFQSRYGKVLFAGLVLSACGDVFLLGSTQQLFLLGLVSFLLAHLVYVAAFVTWGINFRWSLLAAVFVVIVSLGVSVWLTPYISGDMMLPVRIYTLVITVMVIAAFGARGAGGPGLIPLGALLFYVSDLSVAAGRFVQPDFPNYAWGLPLYYTGQVLLALSVAAAVSRKDP